MNGQKRRRKLTKENDLCRSLIIEWEGKNVRLRPYHKYSEDSEDSWWGERCTVVCGTKPGCFETSNHPLSHKLGSELVSGVNKRTSECPSSYVPIHG